jgi:hypothetical protein
MIWDILWKTLTDLKEPKILVRLFVPLVAGLILVSVMGYGLFGLLLMSDQLPFVETMSLWWQQAEANLQSIPLIGAALVWVVSAIVAVTAGVIGVLVGSYLVLLFAMIIAGFMSDTLVRVVRDKHYPGLEYHGHGSIWQVIGRLVWYGLWLVLLLIITLPVMFIPGVNVLWFWWLGFLFFRYSMVLDVGSIILPQQLFEQEKSLTNWTPTVLLLIFYGLSVVPLLSLFVPMVAVIALSHYFFERLTEAQVAAQP